MQKSSNKNLHKANKAKKDEFYTQLVDIENEIKHYREQFYGKVVYCNCDDPFESNFFKYFASNFNVLGLKKLIATSYTKSPIVGQQILPLDIEGLKPDGKKSYAIEINEVPDINNDGAIDLEDVEFILKHNENVSMPLRGDKEHTAGDFRSKECIELLKEADIVVTNPPFSLFREYIAQLMDYDKKFLIIGSKNAITYKECFKLIGENKMWLGPGFSGGNAYFRTPYDNDNYASGVYNSETGLVKFRNVGWFTNLDYEGRHDDLVLYRKYAPESYQKYDNYDAIEVSKVSEIPMDYNGIMGVPVTFLDKYNPEQFEILGITDRQNTSGLRTKKYTINDSVKFNDLNARSVLKIGNSYQSVYARLLIKNKKVKRA